MGLILSQVWTSTGSSGPVGTVECRHGVRDITCYIAHSTIITTNSFSLQSAIESSGPWFVEGSTQLSTGNAAAASTSFRLQITGPVGPWIRGYLHTASTGTYNVLVIGLD